MRKIEESIVTNRNLDKQFVVVIRRSVYLPSGVKAHESEILYCSFDNEKQAAKFIEENRYYLEKNFVNKFSRQIKHEIFVREQLVDDTCLFEEDTLFEKDTYALFQGAFLFLEIKKDIIKR